MKTIKFIFAAIIAISVSVSSFAQTNKKTETTATRTETIKVSGNCESCKARIEKAAKVPGVTKTDWSIKTKLLTVTYDPKKVTNDVIQKNIAAVGHDTPKYKATDKVYNALPSCCKYK
ncbi:MAG: heavy-metal-associated domain-containing protein [Paludibacter sp.]|nr:heavy-metal-associated domain-containing protein [Paludibacter sp.]